MKVLFTLTILILEVFCSIAQSPQLIFRSGFEPGSQVVNQSSSDCDIIGLDSSVASPNDWVNDLENHPNIGDFKIQYQGGSSSERLAEILTDPTDSTNKVLKYWTTHGAISGSSRDYTRIQGNVYGNNGLTNVFHKFRMYLPHDWDPIKYTYTRDLEWMTITEYWNNANWTSEGDEFRITVNIQKLSTGPDSLYLQVHGDDRSGSWNTYWDTVNTTFFIPTGKWITVTSHFIEGDAANGRIIIKMQPDGEPETVVHDIRNFTHGPNDNSPDGLSHFNPLKLYTSEWPIDHIRNNGGVMNILWDDLEIWKDVPEQTTGIEKVTNSNVLYNTIVHDVLSFSSATESAIDHVVIYDLNGKVVHQKSFKSIKWGELDISFLESANYIVHFKTESGIIVGKLVKIK